jgi:hypothetical protein
MRSRQLIGAALLMALLVGALGAPAQTAAPAVTIQRVAVPAVYTPGQIIDVTVTITKNDSRDVTAIAVVDTVPGTWTLQSFSATTPVMTPLKGPDVINTDGTKTLSFYYINIPAFPIIFSYRVATGLADTGPLSISGLAKFRFSGAEEQSPVVVTPVMATAPSEGEGEPAPDGGCTGCTGCSQGAKDLGITLGDLFVSALALVTLLALSGRRG